MLSIQLDKIRCSLDKIRCKVSYHLIGKSKQLKNSRKFCPGFCEGWGIAFSETPPPPPPPHSPWLPAITTWSYEHKSQPPWGTSYSIIRWVNLFLRAWYHQQDAWWHTERLILLLESSIYLFSLTNTIRNGLREISCWDFKFNAASWSAWKERPRLSSHFSSPNPRQLRLFTEAQ